MTGKHFVISIVVTTFMLVSNPLMAEPNMKEGKWQVHSKMEMVGMPMQIPAQTFTYCLTKEDMVPRQENPDQSCKMLDSGVKGNSVTWRMECSTPQGPSNIDGKITYKGDTFEGVIKVKQAGMVFIQRMNGKWIGLCK